MCQAFAVCVSPAYWMNIKFYGDFFTYVLIDYLCVIRLAMY